jgi:hypothetical protein
MSVRRLWNRVANKLTDGSLSTRAIPGASACRLPLLAARQDHPRQVLEQLPAVEVNCA